MKHEKSQAFGRVLDRKRLIFKSREHGTYQYDQKHDKFLPPPPDFCIKTLRSNAREKLIVDFGNVYFIQKYIENLGLWPVFESVGYGNMDSFKALLSYYILESQSNAHAQAWCEGSFARIAYPKALMESPRISDMLKALGDESLQRRFFENYIGYLKTGTKEAGKGYVLIDSTGLPNDMRLPITAISNHNGDINNEVRLIYVVQRGTGLPIYMRYIPGNVVDVSTLLKTIAELKAMKVDTKFAILDAGYLTLESINVLLDQKVSFLARVKKNWKFYKDIVKKYADKLEDPKNLQVFNHRFVYLKQIQYKLSDDHTIYCYLGRDDERRSNERRQLARSAEEDELTKEEIQNRMQDMGLFMLVSSRRIVVKDLLPLYFEQVFDSRRDAPRLCRYASRASTHSAVIC